jgi:hypothetical protein
MRKVSINFTRIIDFTQIYIYDLFTISLQKLSYIYIIDNKLSKSGDKLRELYCTWCVWYILFGISKIVWKNGKLKCTVLRRTEREIDCDHVLPQRVQLARPQSPCARHAACAWSLLPSFLMTSRLIVRCPDLHFRIWTNLWRITWARQISVVNSRSTVV